MRMRLLIAAVSIAAAGLAQTNPPLPNPGNVTLPVDEYNRLVELAAKQPKATDTAPVPYVLKSAQMSLQVNGESVTGTVVLEGEVLTAREQKIPLVSRMIVLEAQQQGRPLPIEQEGGTHYALLSGPAEFAVTLQIGLPLTIETGRASFRLPAPAAGAVRLSLSVPGDETQVNLGPGLITDRSSRDGRTKIEATLPGGQAVSIWWASRLIAPARVEPQEARFLSDMKTLISVRREEVAIAELAEISVVRGEPAEFAVPLPDGFELTGATGPDLLQSEVKGNTIVLRIGGAASRAHQFLISLVKANTGTKIEIPVMGVRGAQRETGEVLVEGEGAIELSATERGGLRRMDLKEANPYLVSLAHAPLHTAFRYQRRPSEAPVVALEWTRFPDSQVLPAVADRAVVTTLVTSEGRSLTQVKLRVSNHSQPFLKVTLPPGASILSSEVAGEKVKPVLGADGARVPLLRAGFRPMGSYPVTFVFAHAGTPFAKKGAAELALPPMDLPIGLVDWEVFLPSRFRLADFGGDAMSARLLRVESEDGEEAPVFVRAKDIGPLAPGMVGGVVTDPQGAPISDAQVKVMNFATNFTRTVTTDPNGRWILGNMPGGKIQIAVSAHGFTTAVREVEHDSSRGTRWYTTLNVGATSETVTVTADAASVMTSSAQLSQSRDDQRRARQNAASPEVPASANVLDLQKRVVGVLPIAIDVPKTGTSYRFARPLVVDEETKLTFQYRSR